MLKEMRILRGTRARWSILVWLLLAETTSAAPSVRIVAPEADSKLYEQTPIDVVVEVTPLFEPVGQWKVQILRPPGPPVVLASGTLPVAGTSVARLSATSFDPGSAFTLQLVAQAQGGSESATQVSVIVPDAHYALIPLEPGNFTRNFIDGESLDATGNRIAFGGSPALTGSLIELFVLDTARMSRRSISLPLASSIGHGLTRGGERYFFEALNFIEGAPEIDYFDLANSATIHGPTGANEWFSVDGTGRRLAFMSNLNLDPDVGNVSGNFQYFVFDFVSGISRQITNSPDAIVLAGDPTLCPPLSATRPVFTSDGNAVILLTASALGQAGVPLDAGCNLFSYDVPSGSLKYVRSFEKRELVFNLKPSADGSLLSVSLTKQGERTTAGLVDMRTGVLSYPWSALVGVAPLFDAPLADDASMVILSTNADLDPGVGNPDGNFELFAYNLKTGGVEQVSDTLGSFQGNCPSLLPKLNRDASVALFVFNRISTPLCFLDRSQRNLVNGLALGRVRAIRKRLGNHSPVLTIPNSARVMVGEELILSFEAVDPDDDPVVFFAQQRGDIDVPAGSSITDNLDGTATFRWLTTDVMAGTIGLRVAAFDQGGGETFRDTTLAVCRSIIPGVDTPTVVTAIFESEPSSLCRDADINGDGKVTAADALLSASSTTR